MEVASFFVAMFSEFRKFRTYFEDLREVVFQIE